LNCTNKEITPSNASHTSCLNSSDQFSNLVAVNQMAHSTMQNSENIKLKNMDVMADMPITTDLSNNLNFISTNNLSENMDCTRRSFHSDDLLIKQSSSIKKIEKKLESLENKMKEFATLKKKQNIYSCHGKYKNNILLNPDLLSAICKGIAQYHNEERQKDACFKNKRNTFRKHKHNTRTREKIKKRKRLKKYNTYEDSFLWKIECFDKNFLQDILCNKAENAAKENNISPFEHDTSYKTIHNTNRDNSILDVNTSGQPLNNEPVEEPILFMRENPESISRLTKIESVKDNSVCLITNSSLTNNEIPINHNLSCKDNTEYIDLDNQMASETMLSLPNSQNPIDHANKKIIMMENKIKGKNKFKKSITNRLLRKIKNLKKKTQVNLHMNKQENNTLCSHYNFEHNELTKSKIQEPETDNLKDNDSLKINNRKRKSSILENSSINVEQENIECPGHHGLVKKIRIAHIPKSSNITVLETCQQKRDEDQLDKPTQIQENIFLIKNEKNYMMKKKDETNTIEYYDEMYSIDNESDEKNSMKNRVHFNDNNFSSSDIDIEQTSMEFDKYDNVNGIMDASASILTKKVIAKISNTCNDSDVSCNMSYNIVKNLEFEKYTISNTKIQSPSKSPSSFYKDSEYDKSNENIERNMQMKKIEITEEMSDNELQCPSDMTTEKDSNVYTMSEDTILHNRLSISNRSNALETLHHDSHDDIDHNIFNATSRFQYLPMSKDNGVIENFVSNNNKLNF